MQSLTSFLHQSSQCYLFEVHCSKNHTSVEQPSQCSGGDRKLVSSCPFFRKCVFSVVIKEFALQKEKLRLIHESDRICQKFPFFQISPDKPQNFFKNISSCNFSKSPSSSSENSWLYHFLSMIRWFVLMVNWHRRTTLEKSGVLLEIQAALNVLLKQSSEEGTIITLPEDGYYQRIYHFGRRGVSHFVYRMRCKI